MKQRQTARVWAMAVAALVAAHAGTQTACAGKWMSRGYVMQGQDKATSTPSAQPQPTPRNWDTDWLDGWGVGRFALSQPSNYVDTCNDGCYEPRAFTGTASSAGSIAFKFEWVPDAGKTLQTDPLPRPSYFKVRGLAQAEAHSPFSFSLSPTLDNGFVGKPGNVDVVRRTQPPGNSDYAEYHTLDYTVLLPVSSQQFVTVTVPLKAVSNLSGQGKGSVSAMVEADVTPDKRRLTLSRSGARGPVKQEGDPGVTIDPTHDEYIAADGTAHGQTRWSYTDRTDASVNGFANYYDSLITVSQIIVGQPSGLWSSNVTGAWSPSDSRDRVPPQTAQPPTAEKKEWTFFDLSASQKIELKTNFGASFKAGDWLKAGGSIETTGSLEIKSSYASTAVVYLMPGDKAWPKIDYIVRTQHKLVDHYDSSGWDANAGRTDGKWDQSADLALQPQDIAPGWIVQRNSGGNSTP